MVPYSVEKYFPLWHWTKVKASQVKHCFQEWFEEWGLPDCIRFDNGKPWANPGQRHVPTALSLWLIGLGIQVVFGRPRQSTDNAVVERSHGVLTHWVEPDQRQGLADLQRGLHQFVHIQRAVYPSCQGRSRLETYPELMQSKRRYRRDQDEILWQLQRVMDYVSTLHFQRMVEKNGRITHMTQEYSVGRQYAAQHVTVFLDAQTHQWVIEDRHGEILKRFDANQLNYLTISQLKMAYRNGLT